jgi:thiol-disulfide isomerase/thioredoxin
LAAGLCRTLAAATFLLGATGADAGEELVPSEGTKPAFVLSDLSGADVRLAAQQGRVVLVHFFATWCEPCREELPALKRLVERSAAKPVAVLAISVGEVDARVVRFMEGLPVNFPVLLDRERAVAKSWDVYTLPTTYVLDETLTPKLVVNGDFAWDTLTPERLRDMIAATPAKPTNHSGSTRTQEGG